jgi:outer membrane receptor for ferrienterochelin and colicins
MPSTPLQLTTLAAALACCLTAYAAPDTKEAAPVAKVEVKGALAGYDARRDDTASRIIVSHDEIVKFGDTNVFDVLKRLPGITVSGNGPRGGEVRMRGLGRGYTQVLIDGQPAPSGFSIDSVAPASIERIEIMRAATADLSTQAIAGTINIVLRKAIRTAQRNLTLRTESGEGAGLSPSVDLQLADKRDQLSWSMGVNALRNNFARTAPVTDQESDGAGTQTVLREHSVADDGHFARLVLAPRLNWTFADGDTLTWQARTHLTRFVRNLYDTADTLAGPAPVYPYIEEHQRTRGAYLQSDLNWVSTLASGAKVDIKLGGFVSRQRESNGQTGYTAIGGALAIDTLVASRNRESGYNTAAKYALALGDGHSLAAGWDARTDRRDETRREDQLALEQYAADVTRLALFAQDEWTVTPAWSVYAGLRWEAIATEVSGNSFADISSRSRVWSPVFQTLYKIPDRKGDQLRFALTRTYKAPYTSSLIPRVSKTLNNGAVLIDNRGNPGLRPELAVGFDTSYEHYWADGAMVSVGASMRAIDDVIRIQTAPDANGRYVSTEINDGKAHTRGLEFEAKFPLKAIMADAPAVDLRASFSRNWSSVDAVPGPNNRLGQQTPFSATLGMDYKAGQLGAGASFAFRNGGPVRLSAHDSTYVSVRRALDAYALWKFDPKHTARLSLSNLLGQDQTAARIYSDDAGTRQRLSVYPANITVRLSLELKY